MDDLATVKFAEETCEYGQIKNLSLTGMFVSCRLNKPQKGLCHIWFAKKNKPGHVYLEITGEYVWGSKEGVGLKFTSVDFDNYMTLISTLINNSKQPTVILYELPKNCPYEVTN